MLGKYRILHRVGSGGMGTVYAAWDTQLERRVAIKMVHPHLLANPLVSKRFLQEARAAARVEHPNVVRVYGMATVGDDLIIEMQYIDGTPLSSLLRPVPLPAGQAADLLGQVLAGLVACHAQGVIHCDLKPSNLLFDAGSHLYITDFGIARALQRSGEDEEGITATTGMAWGTPRYTPPEAWNGERPTPAWDLYSLGLMVYEALVARPAFQANTPAALMAQILTATPEPLREERPDLSEEFVQLIDEMMAREPASRPPSATAVLTRLQRTPELQLAQADTQPLPKPRSRMESGLYGAPRRRWRIPFPFNALLVLVLVSAILAFAFKWRENPHQDPAAISKTSQPVSPAGGATPSASSSVDGEGAPPLESGAAAETVSLPEPSELLAVRDGVFFAYDDGVHGRELWFANTAGQLVMPKDIVPGPGSGNPQYLHTRAGEPEIAFSSDSAEFGRELWSCRVGDFPNFEVKVVRDIISGRMGSEPQLFHSLDNVYFFYATTLHSGRELWLSNGREQQTAIVTDLFPGVPGSAMMTPKYVAAPRGFYFLALRDAAFGQQLFYYDHDNLHVAHIGDVSEDTAAMAVCDNGVLLASNDPDHGMEPWIAQTKPGNLQRLIDIHPGPVSSDPNHFFSFRNRVYFVARTDAAGRELWVSDGTPEGTSLLVDVNPGPEESDTHAFVDGGDRMYFRAVTPEYGKELWSTDGTPEGTRIVADVWPGPDSGEPYNISVSGNRVFFTAKEPGTGEELWMADFDQGGAVSRVTDLAPGPESGEPHNFRVVGTGMGMFSFKSAKTGPALAMVDWNLDPPVVKVIELPHAIRMTVTPDS